MEIDMSTFKASFAIFFLCGLLGGLGDVMLDASHEAALSTNWPKASGKIFSSEVVRHQDRNDEWYEAVVEYTYEVDSKSYRGDRIAWTPSSFGTKSEARKYLDDRYPGGRTIDVHYDPYHPNRVCLVPGHDRYGKLKAYGLAALIPVFLLLGGGES